MKPLVHAWYHLVALAERQAERYRKTHPQIPFGTLPYLLEEATEKNVTTSRVLTELGQVMQSAIVRRRKDPGLLVFLIMVSHGWARLPTMLPCFVLKEYLRPEIQPVFRCHRAACRTNWPVPACPQCGAECVQDQIGDLLVNAPEPKYIKKLSRKAEREQPPDPAPTRIYHISVRR
jgi:hypothetical protein